MLTITTSDGATYILVEIYI